jgi:hypothetical protein
MHGMLDCGSKASLDRLPAIQERLERIEQRLVGWPAKSRLTRGGSRIVEMQTVQVTGRAGYGLSHSTDRRIPRCLGGIGGGDWRWNGEGFCGDSGGVFVSASFGA